MQQSKEHEKVIFLLLFREQNFVLELGNVTTATSFIYNSHTLPVFFSSFVSLGKSLRKYFLCKVNLADFQRQFSRAEVTVET